MGNKQSSTRKSSKKHLSESSNSKLTVRKTKSSPNNRRCIESEFVDCAPRQAVSLNDSGLQVRRNVGNIILSESFKGDLDIKEECSTLTVVDYEATDDDVVAGELVPSTRIDNARFSLNLPMYSLETVRGMLQQMQNKRPVQDIFVEKGTFMSPLSEQSAADYYSHVEKEPDAKQPHVDNESKRNELIIFKHCDAPLDVMKEDINEIVDFSKLAAVAHASDSQDFFVLNADRKSRHLQATASIDSAVAQCSTPIDIKTELDHRECNTMYVDEDLTERVIDKSVPQSIDNVQDDSSSSSSFDFHSAPLSRVSSAGSPRGFLQAVNKELTSSTKFTYEHFAYRSKVSSSFQPASQDDCSISPISPSSPTNRSKKSTFSLFGSKKSSKNGSPAETIKMNNNSGERRSSQTKLSSFFARRPNDLSRNPSRLPNFLNVNDIFPYPAAVERDRLDSDADVNFNTAGCLTLAQQVA